MDLVDRREFRILQKRGDGEPPIARDCLRVVMAAVTDVEPGAFASGNSPAEEAVGQAAEADRADDLDAAHSILRMMMSWSAWLPTMKS